MPKFSLKSNFERALYLFSLPQKYRILVRHATLTAIHGPSHSGQTPSVPRLANQYLCEMNMSMRASASLHILIQNASFFSLRSQVPIFSTPITGARIVPIGSRALYQVISQTGLYNFAFHQVTSDYDTWFFLRKGLHLSKSKDIFFSTRARLQDFPM